MKVIVCVGLSVSVSLIEVEGGIFMRGRHVRPMGFKNDIFKYNLLLLYLKRVMVNIEK